MAPRLDCSLPLAMYSGSAARRQSGEARSSDHFICSQRQRRRSRVWRRSLTGIRCASVAPGSGFRASTPQNSRSDAVPATSLSLAAKWQRSGYVSEWKAPQSIVLSSTPIGTEGRSLSAERGDKMSALRSSRLAGRPRIVVTASPMSVKKIARGMPAAEFGALGSNNPRNTGKSAAWRIFLRRQIRAAQ